jgi:hypothetical protein
MIKNLINLANELDDKGLKKEADFLDNIIKNARSGSHSLSWPAEIWPHTLDIAKIGDTLSAIAKAARSDNDNISKKCADMTAIGKLAYGLPTDGVLGDIIYRRFKDGDFCYTIAEVAI